MAKDTIKVDGEETVVREDTAKAYRGTIWALISVAAFIVIGAIIFFAVLGGSLGDGKLESPKEIEKKRQ